MRCPHAAPEGLEALLCQRRSSEALLRGAPQRRWLRQRRSSEAVLRRHSSKARVPRRAPRLVASLGQLLAAFAVVVDESVGGGVVGACGALGAQLGQDLLGQLLSELDTPLVEAVDVPDDSLHENLMFVHGDESAESVGAQLIEHERVGRLIAREDLVRQKFRQRLALEPRLLELGLRLGRRFALHQRLRLRKEVGEQ